MKSMSLRARKIVCLYSQSPSKFFCINVATSLDLQELFSYLKTVLTNVYRFPNCVI